MNNQPMSSGLSKTGIIVIIAAVSIAVIGIIYSATRPEEVEYDFVLTERTDLTQLVSVTGRVRPEQKVDLSFEVTGTIDAVLAEVGDTVNTGDIIVSLSNFELMAERAQAGSNLLNERAGLRQFDAALQVEEAILSELKKGTRIEDINVSKTRLDNYQKAKDDSLISLNNTYQKAKDALSGLYDDAKDEINDAYVAIDDTINIKTDDMFSDNVANKGNFVFLVFDPNVEVEAKQKRDASINVLEKLENILAAFPASHTLIDEVLDEAEEDMLVVQDFLFTLTQALASEINLDPTTKRTFQTNIDAARDEIKLVKSSISAKIQEISAQKVANSTNIDSSKAVLNDATNAITLAQEELNLKQAGTLPEVIASQEARVQQALANIEAQNSRISSAGLQLDIINSRIDKTVLRAPINGIVIIQNAKVGEVSSFGDSITEPLVSIMTEDNFKIEANIPEVDIAKISRGNMSELTMDAYGPDVVFEARVHSIDPAETVIEGVPTYRVTFYFTEPDVRIKSGMTANMDILTAEMANVIAVPQRAVITRNGKKYVRILNGVGFVEREVQTGLTSWDGQIEISTGLKAGEQVITFIED